MLIGHLPHCRSLTAVHTIDIIYSCSVATQANTFFMGDANILPDIPLEAHISEANNI